MNFQVVLITVVILFINVSNSNCYKNLNELKKFLFDKLNINKQEHKINRRSLQLGNVLNHENSHMIDIYKNLNNNRDLNEFDSVQNYKGYIVSSSSQNLKFQVYKLNKNKSINLNKTYLQLIELNNNKLKFRNLNNQNLKNLVHFELNLNLNFKKIFKPINLNRAKIELLLKHNDELLDKKSIFIYSNNLTESTKFKFKSNKIFPNELSLSLKIKFKTNFVLKRKFIKNLFNKSLILTVYFKQQVDKKDNLNKSNEDYIQQELNRFDVNELEFESNIQNDTISKCQKKPVLINFKQVGWDNFIVEPKYLKTYYCDGSCNIPFEDDLSATNHAILRALASKNENFNYLPKVCCMPSKLASKVFLILDENGSLVLKKIDNILVESCSCQ